MPQPAPATTTPATPACARLLTQPLTSVLTSPRSTTPHAINNAHTHSVEHHKVVLVAALAAAPLLHRWLGCSHDSGANFGAAHPHTRSARRQLAQLSRQRDVTLDVAGALQRRRAPSDRARPDAARVLAQRLVVALR